MKPTKYGKSTRGIFTIATFDGETVTPTCIFHYKYSRGAYTEIIYNYDVPANTIESSDFEYISRLEFYKILRQIKSDQNVQITVKMKWL